MKVKYQVYFLLLFFCVLLTNDSQAQFRNSRGQNYPYATEIGTNDVFILGVGIGTAGNTNKNVRYQVVKEQVEQDVVLHGSNNITAGTISSNRLDATAYAAFLGGGSGSAQTNISYTAVTNAPWANTNAPTLFSPKVATLTPGRVVIAGADGLLTDHSGLTYDSGGGNLSVQGNVGGESVSGSGAALTDLNASELATGTVPNNVIGAIHGSNNITAGTISSNRLDATAYAAFIGGGGSGTTEYVGAGQNISIATNGNTFTPSITGTLTNPIAGTTISNSGSAQIGGNLNVVGQADFASGAATIEPDGDAVFQDVTANNFSGNAATATYATSAGNATNVFGNVPSTDIPKSGTIILYDFQGGGGRQVPNLAAPSGKMQTWGPPPESYFNELFAYTPVRVTLTDGFEDPEGYYRAVKAVADPTNAYVQFTVSPTLVAASYTVSVWAKAANVTNETFRLGLGVSSYSGTFTVTTTWQRFSYSRDLTAGDYLVLIASTDSNSSPMNLYLYGPQLELGTNASAVPRNYFDATLGKLASSNAFMPTWNVRSLNFTNTQFARAWASRRIFLNQATVYAAIRRPTNPTYVLSGYNPICTDEGSSPKIHLNTENVGGVGSFTFSGQVTKNWTMDLKDSEWHLVTGTHNGNTTRLYVDNFCVGSNYTGTVSTNFELRRWFVGNLNNSAYFNGDMAWMALYDSGHSALEVAANYNAFKAKLSNAGNAMNGVRRTLIFEGDSITDQATIGTGVAMYPWNVATNLSVRPHSRNFAASGATLDNGANSLTNRAAMVDELRLGQTNVLSILIGANDLGSLTATQTTNWVARLKTYCDARQALGWRISLCTILPRTTAGFNTQRNIANDLIRADTSFYDSLADLAADTTIGEDADASDGTYYSDGTHPTVAGHAIIGPIVRASVATLLGL